MWLLERICGGGVAVRVIVVIISFVVIVAVVDVVVIVAVVDVVVIVAVVNDTNVRFVGGVKLKIDSPSF